MLLRKRQRNEIYSAIQDGGLKPMDLSVSSSADRIRIVHPSSGLWFAIASASEPDRYNVACVPAESVDVMSYDNIFYSQLVVLAEQWADEVKYETETPDFWAELADSGVLSSGLSRFPGPNDLFSAQERQEVADRLDQLQADIAQRYQLDAEQLIALEIRVDYLVNATSRIGKFDWRALLIGTLLAYLLDVALPPQDAREVMTAFVHAINDFYTHSQLGGG